LVWWALGDVGAALRRSFGFAQDDKVRGSEWQGERLRMAGSPSMSSRPQWRDLQQLAASFLVWWALGDVGAALRRSFGFAQDDKVRGSGWQGLPVCHPDRSGGISSGWQRALVWWLL